jgi:hypothetical protein
MTHLYWFAESVDPAQCLVRDPVTPRPRDCGARGKRVGSLRARSRAWGLNGRARSEMLAWAHREEGAETNFREGLAEKGGWVPT